MALMAVPQRNMFCKDDRVEVRSEEEQGFEGSWHSGVVIETPKLLDSQIKYVIKYDHMLVDDESDYYIQTLLVNECIEASCKRIRGRIRPIPPPLKNINIWDIYYGMCVDVFYNECWWEGVVFDYEDGSETRTVFFPDMGDEMNVPIAHMRVTQDWNEATGTWKSRGTWFFLALLEELEDGLHFRFSPKQFWFDVREKHKIQKLGDWTCSDEQLWKILVLETLGDKLKIIMDHSKSANLVNVNVQQYQSDVSVHPEPVRVSPVRVSPQDLSLKHSWIPAGPDMVPGPEYCPDAVIEYLQLKRSNKKHQVSVLDVRKHLLHLNWKIDYSRDDRIRLRYTSSDGQVFYSLRQVCLNLTQDENGSSLRKRRGLIKLQNKRVGTRNPSVLRTSKRVNQVAVPNKSLTVLSWLIDNNIVRPRAKVHLFSRTSGGCIIREGIKCNCCCKVYNLAAFTFHVSGKYHKRPASSICLEDGSSLLDGLKKIVHREMEEPPGFSKGSLHQGENDHICSVCLYGGELLLCDHCPSSFHKACLALQVVPEGDWFCPSCCCKICGTNCSIKDDTSLNCTQCERKYHIWCIRSTGKSCLKKIPRGNWFCTEKCEEIFLGLKELLGKPIPVGLNNLTWTLLKPNHWDGHELDGFNDEAWIENCSKLSIAVDIMHECFEPVEDPHTKRDLLKDVIFNKRSELNRLNFGGFYTVILQKDDEFISVAAIRVYGEKVAELPLVGTRFQHRRLGMCRLLMNVLEKKLVELGVERLILPAVPCVLNTWIGSFGFSKLMVSERLQLVDYTFLDFQDTVMCHKQLKEIPCAEPREILPRLCNMDLEGSTADSKVCRVDRIQAGTCDQDATATNSNTHAERPIDPVTTVDSESEPCFGKITIDISIEKKEPRENNMEVRHGVCGLMVYKRRRSEKHELSGEYMYRKRRRLDSK